MYELLDLGGGQPFAENVQVEGQDTAGVQDQELVVAGPDNDPPGIMDEGPQRRPLVYVSAGGGADGQLLMRTYVEAVRTLGSRAQFSTLMAVGPLPV